MKHLQMSGLEWKALIALTLSLALNYYTPTLWSGIWDAKTSNASSLYGVGLVGVVGLTVTWFVFVWVIMTTYLENRRRSKVRTR